MRSTMIQNRVLLFAIVRHFETAFWNLICIFVYAHHCPEKLDLVVGVPALLETLFDGCIWQVVQLRRNVEWFNAQLKRSESSWKGRTGSSFRSTFQEEAWKRYNRRMQEEYEEEMERVERIRRMQSVFNRERNKHKRSYESWRQNGSGAYHQHFQRDDWSGKTPYTEAEIKKAFRAKAKEFHPDQNQDNKEFYEAKFKEVMISYEAIKQERKDMKS
ncbi:hypothetical protein GH714_022090 [Hevea brasiliensis]|uniref:J domain-containing protein n=1 Tax=Hevea brasiliensis TaxID=3981 RepID=A0A6A6NIM8_HEVBR|nr:hypothetical protein GH714_022090 [Hevea brasiliensis]